MARRLNEPWLDELARHHPRCDCSDWIGIYSGQRFARRLGFPESLVQVGRNSRRRAIGTSRCHIPGGAASVHGEGSGSGRRGCSDAAGHFRQATVLARSDCVGFDAGFAGILVFMFDTGVLVEWLFRHKSTKIDEMIVATAVLLVGLSFFSVRRSIELREHLNAYEQLHEQSESERSRLCCAGLWVNSCRYNRSSRLGLRRSSEYLLNNKPNVLVFRLSTTSPPRAKLSPHELSSYCAKVAAANFSGFSRTRARHRNFGQRH
jgi:hypothetical protein